jgi:CspA family cold shock protein
MLLQKIKSLFTRKQSTVKIGFVKFFNRKRGYGFIHSPQTSKDVFVHITELNDKVRVGDQVKFELEFNKRGLIAKNVCLAIAS